MLICQLVLRNFSLSDEIANGSKHRRSQDFPLGGGANHKSHAMTSLETSKEIFCGGKDIVK